MVEICLQAIMIITSIIIMIMIIMINKIIMIMIMIIIYIIMILFPVLHCPALLHLLDFAFVLPLLHPPPHKCHLFVAENTVKGPEGTRSLLGRSRHNPGQRGTWFRPDHSCRHILLGQNRDEPLVAVT